MSLRAASWLVSCSVAFAGCASSGGASAAGGSPADGTGGSGERAAQIASTRAQLDEITSAWSSYTFAVGRCPQTVDDLVAPPGGEPFLAKAPVDPWGNAYATMPGTDGAATQIVSAGPDGELLTEDDIAARATCTEP